MENGKWKNAARETKDKEQEANDEERNTKGFNRKKAQKAQRGEPRKDESFSESTTDNYQLTINNTTESRDK